MYDLELVYLQSYAPQQLKHILSLPEDMSYPLVIPPHVLPPSSALGYLLSVSIDFYSASVQFSSVAQSCPTLCDPMNRSMPGLPVHHQLPEFNQTHVHWVGDAIQQSYPLLSPSSVAFNLSQHQGLFKWVSSSHQVAKILAFQLQHESFQWTLRTDLL